MTSAATSAPSLITQTLLPTAEATSTIVETASSKAPEVIVKNDKIRQLIAVYSSKYDVDSRIATSIAACESELRQYTKDGKVLRGTANPDDVGVFQINERYHLDESKKRDLDIYTTEGNIEYGIWLLKHEGVRHWKASRSCWDPETKPLAKA